MYRSGISRTKEFKSNAINNAINTIQGLIVSRLAKKLYLTPGKVNVAIR